MWRLAVTVILLGGARGCDSADGTYLEPLMSPGSPGGRYVLRWCNNNVGKLQGPQVMWESFVRVDDRSATQCVARRPYLVSSRYHSELKQVRAQNARCSPTCMSSTLDLIYSGCYTIENNLYVDVAKHKVVNASDTHYISINNSYNFDYFSSSITTISAISFQNDVQIKVQFGSIPLLNYSLELFRVDSVSEDPGVGVSECEPASPHLLQCRHRDLPPGHYEVLLEHHAPWTKGELFNIDTLYRILHHFEHTNATSSRSPEVPVGRSGLYVWSGVAGALLVTAVCGAGWLLWRRRARAKRLQEDVKNGWRQRLSSKKEEAEGSKEDDTYGPILLLYARDAEPFMDAMVLLRTLLADHTGCKVYDLTEAGTIRSLSAAPTEWIRSAVSDPRVRLVLVETPAAQHLYCGGAGPDGVVEPPAPPLPTRVLYRRPDYCDTLLQYALRLTRDDALQLHKHYHKYFVATLCMFPAEVVPTVAPYRRYQLPQHSARLARDLAPARTAAPSPELQERLSATLDRFSCHARDNPHYLQDELMFL